MMLLRKSQDVELRSEALTDVGSFALLLGPWIDASRSLEQVPEAGPGRLRQKDVLAERDPVEPNSLAGGSCAAELCPTMRTSDLKEADFFVSCLDV